MEKSVYGVYPPLHHWCVSYCFVRVITWHTISEIHWTFEQHSLNVEVNGENYKQYFLSAEKIKFFSKILKHILTYR